MDNQKSFIYKVPENHRHAVVVEVELGFSVCYSAIENIAVMRVKTRALIDTGASSSCISYRLANACHLESTESTSMRSAQGSIVVPIYDVDIFLPNDIEFRNVDVLGFIGGRDFDMIIGMDLLSRCDFAITNANSETVFTLRIPPSEQHLDFTK